VRVVSVSELAEQATFVARALDALKCLRCLRFLAIGILSYRTIVRAGVSTKAGEDQMARTTRPTAHGTSSRNPPSCLARNTR
jgi:hypothetical protein